MDTSQVAVISRDKQASVERRRQRRSIAEKRRIVEETWVEGASVVRVARAHGINANQVFGWRRLYQAGRLGPSASDEVAGGSCERECAGASGARASPRTLRPFTATSAI